MLALGLQGCIRDDLFVAYFVFWRIFAMRNLILRMLFISSTCPGGAQTGHLIPFTLTSRNLSRPSPARFGHCIARYKVILRPVESPYHFLTIWQGQTIKISRLRLLYKQITCYKKKWFFKIVWGVSGRSLVICLFVYEKICWFSWSDLEAEKLVYKL